MPSAGRCSVAFSGVVRSSRAAGSQQVYRSSLPGGAGVTPLTKGRLVVVEAQPRQGRGTGWIVLVGS